MFSNTLYYNLKPLIPRWLQIQIRRQIVRRKRAKYSHVWPIDERAAKPPEGWTGWPGGKKFALVLTHDVETIRGVDRIPSLAELEKGLGFRSSFNFVAEEYPIPSELFKYLRTEGFEVGLHGLNHKGNLFESRKKFETQAPRINRYLKEWGVTGFRAPIMYHNLDWTHDLNIEYDSSTFDTDPFEPQPDGTETIFPFWVFARDGQRGYVELPYTLPQDFTLFALMREDDIHVWKKKLGWIAENGGMALLITHPDYMNFIGEKEELGQYPAKLYEEFLIHIKEKHEGEYWNILPKELVRFLQNGKDLLERKEIKRFPIRRRPLRVCMVAYSFYESDNRVMRYADTLAERGDKVDVIALRKKGQAEFEVMNSVNIYRVQERALDERSKFSYVSRLLRFFYNSSMFLSKQHIKNPYQLIHVHSLPDFEVFAGMFPKLLGATLILDIHDILPEFYASKFNSRPEGLIFKLLATIEKASAAFSDHVIISNHLWEQKLLSRSLERERCTVILNYPDPNLFHPRPRVRKDDRFIFLYPGSLNWHQGLDIAVKAFSTIAKQVRKAEFHICGEGGEMSRLQEMVIALDLTDHVLLKPPVPISKIPHVMADADVGVVPKRNDSFGGEAFSTKILEFMSTGIPVIVAGTKIDKYYFNDSVVKFFEPENVNALSESMLEMIKNSELRTALAQNALKFVEDFSWEKRKWEYLDLVDRLTNSGNRKP
jgi:glycosyltransferase involved in cell wall biosynthesis/peptidoglycan/xylan/chitin deacetylase (PgdA/CDA1 family)